MTPSRTAWSGDKFLLVILLLAPAKADAMRSNNNNNNNNRYQVQPANDFEQNPSAAHRWRNESAYTARIMVNAYNVMGQITYHRSVADLLVTSATEWDWWMCDPRRKFALILHGWRESCEVAWVRMLVGKLHEHRGGCIMCWDYSNFTGDAYIRLVRHFDQLSAGLTQTLQQLQQLGFQLKNGYVFGFSFGGQLAAEAGRRVGAHRLDEVDTCDMAGPGFDHRPFQPDHRLAARNVQCVHTASGDKGTRYMRCHQNWRLGNCGHSQAAAAQPPCGSHGLCPYMYVASFDVKFRAVRRPDVCSASSTEVTSWPREFSMGYTEMRKSMVRGELFAYTTNRWPYSVDVSQNVNITIEEIPLKLNGEDDYDWTV